MARSVDREIEAWSNRPVRDQFSLLWEVVEKDEVKVVSYWEGREWASTYVISASQARLPLPGRWWALCFIEPGREEPVEFLRSDDSEGKGGGPPLTDARSIRSLLEVRGIEERPELCSLLITLGARRDEIDTASILRFTKHEDHVVRYVALGVLSWQPSISNDLIAHRFSDDPDPIVADLAARFASGRTRRATRP